MNATKEQAIQAIQGLDDDCTLEDIHYHLYVLEKIERGLEDVQAGRVVSQEEAKRRVEEWLK
ncbi:MAG: hypothetical protein NTX50_29710 [Candidatus Sumerlaeota bacterium]|nr:hypothetical protein [Candidatus Sumerlaeota bacterium]